MLCEGIAEGGISYHIAVAFECDKGDYILLACSFLSLGHRALMVQRVYKSLIGSPVFSCLMRVTPKSVHRFRSCCKSCKIIFTWRFLGGSAKATFLDDAIFFYITLTLKLIVAGVLCLKSLLLIVNEKKKKKRWVLLVAVDVWHIFPIFSVRYIALLPC